ncbi:MAG: ATP-binding protein [Tahibacter sp.]
MSLRRKLLLVALSMLALPWAGWQFVRQMEILLRQGQEQTLIASGKALARSLAAIRAELPALGPALYVHALESPVQIDGYGEEWADFRAYAQNLGPPQNAQKLKLMLAADTAWLYMYAEVRDVTRQRADAHDPQAERADHLELTLQRGDASRRYLIASAAPGPFDALASGNDGGSLPLTLSGEWQEDGGGYRIELRLPLAQMPERMALASHDASEASGFQPEPQALLAFSSLLSGELGQFAPEATHVRLLSAEGWLLGESGKNDNATNPEKTSSVATEQPGLLARLAYRWLIAPALQGSPSLAKTSPRLEAAELWQALSGVAAASWRAGETSGEVILSAAVPLVLNGEIRGALLLEQSNAALPLLTDAALKRLGVVSLAVLLLAAGVLFAFASRLSTRIRLLRDRAERAMAADGRTEGVMPLVDARDELGDLARSFQRLLDSVAAYTDYLRTLASKLSHELHTPLAIVKSSLDNLDHQALPANARAYVMRARDGIERLGATVRAMSEASRTERAIASAEAEDFDLVAVVSGCAEAYRALAMPRELHCSLPGESLPMHGAPELIAQALDKLFDNARSFTPEQGWIRIGLEATPDGALLSMCNLGPALPEAMQNRLFDSLVSVRGAAARDETPHLGLGLTIVRLVTELHGGVATARNLDDGTGVEFRLLLRGMPRQRLGAATNPGG